MYAFVLGSSENGNGDFVRNPSLENVAVSDLRAVALRALEQRFTLTNQSALAFVV